MPESNLSQEWLSISRRLELHHEIFYAIWHMGIPSFDAQTDTAYVFVDEDIINFRFNPDFWDSLEEYDRDFVIAHEALHLILEHIPRIKNTEYPQLANIAADIVINQMLVDRFGFDRSKLKVSGCWKEDFDGLEPDKALEYYYTALLKESNKQEQNKTIDDHKKMLEKSQGQLSNQALKEIGNMLSPESKEFFEKAVKNDMAQAGINAGNTWLSVNPTLPPIKKKWETVIKKWSFKYQGKSSRDKEQWVMLNRRFQFLGNNLFLPTEYETEAIDKTKKKIGVFFFLDTSGSCYHLAERFWKAARSLSPKRFDVKLFCFDTKIYPINIDIKKLYGFGGTSFAVIERFIVKSNPYPQAVFVITDGYGDEIDPKYPERWHWFLSVHNTYYLPKLCHIYNLKDFE